MGLGKTVELISFLTALYFGTSNTRVSDKTHHYARARPTRTHVDPKSCGSVLIICPATVLQQWVCEFHRWWPPFRVAVLHAHTLAQQREQVIDMIAKGGVGHVLVTTYASMKAYSERLHRYRWHYVVLDEGHVVRKEIATLIQIEDP
jgi:DNA excision repair protein ERCC-6